MAAKSELDRIVALLSADLAEKRIAAAIVLGELAHGKASVVKGLSAMLGSSSAAEQRAALEALHRIDIRPAVPAVFGLLSSRDAELRERAVAVLGEVGEAIVPEVKKRLASASPSERRTLESVLARLGGAEALSTLLAGLTEAGEEEGRRATLEMRDEMRGARDKKRKAYTALLTKHLAGLRKQKDASPVALAATVRLLGYLEEPATLASLLELSRSKTAAVAVRQEALIALRFGLERKADAAKVLDAWISAAESDDRVLSQTGLISLNEVEVPARLMPRLTALAAHPDLERARFAIEKLYRQPGEETSAALVELLATQDKDRAELIAQILVGREDAAGPAVLALLAAEAERAWIIRKVALSVAKHVAPAHRKKLFDAVAKRIAAGERGFEPVLDVARAADGEGLAQTLRTLAATLRKAGKLDRAAVALGTVCSHDSATDEDRFALVVLELRSGTPGAPPSARALRALDALLRGHFDVAAALRKEKAIGLEETYSLGFYLIERQNPLGEELLSEVAAKGGRKRIGKMAESKLKLAGYGA